jgi:hypothetical protein
MIAVPGNLARPTLIGFSAEMQVDLYGAIRNNGTEFGFTRWFCKASAERMKLGGANEKEPRPVETPTRGTFHEETPSRQRRGDRACIGHERSARAKC